MSAATATHGGKWQGLHHCIHSNDDTFTQENSVKHGLYQQFCIVNADYARFVDLLDTVSQPSPSLTTSRKTLSCANMDI